VKPGNDHLHSDSNNDFWGTWMQYSGMFPMTVITGFLLVATFGLVAAVQARKAKPLLHYEVALISIGHFRKTGPFSESMICIAKEALLLGRAEHGSAQYAKVTIQYPPVQRLNSR